MWPPSLAGGRVQAAGSMAIAWLTPFRQMAAFYGKKCAFSSGIRLATPTHLAGGGGRPDVNVNRIVSSFHFISLRFSEMKCNEMNCISFHASECEMK
jgi:hypothetical protein